MKIAMLLERQFPYDERVEKEALSLMEDGHTVSILSFNYDDLPEVENYQGIRVVRFPVSRNFYRKLGPLHRLLPFYRRIWLGRSLKFVREFQADVIHVHDLPLANVGFALKRRLECKLVLDQHELWSETVKHYRHYNTVPGKIVRRLSRWRAYERNYLKRADKIITVEKPIQDWYVQNYGLDPDKIIVTQNTPRQKDMIGISSLPKKSETDFVLFYAGKIDANRYLDTVIRALADVRKTIPSVRFDIAGRIAKGCDPRISADRYGVRENVNYLGELSYENMIKKMADADICISLLPSDSEELNRTIVTKVYQYLQLKKPMIVGRTTFIREFVNSGGLGMSVNQGSAEALATAVKILHDNPHRMREMSANAEKIKKKYVWETTVRDLKDYYNGMEQKS